MARSNVLKLGKKGGTPKITYPYLMEAINFRSCALSFTLACQGQPGRVYMAVPGGAEKFGHGDRYSVVWFKGLLDVCSILSSYICGHSSGYGRIG